MKDPIEKKIFQSTGSGWFRFAPTCFLGAKCNKSLLSTNIFSKKKIKVVIILLIYRRSFYVFGFAKSAFQIWEMALVSWGPTSPYSKRHMFFDPKSVIFKHIHFSFGKTHQRNVKFCTIGVYVCVFKKKLLKFENTNFRWTKFSSELDDVFSNMTS
jgi:hypothetical protein